jgi:hypothetical protein
VNIGCKAVDEENGEGEKGGKNESDGGIGGNESVVGEELDEINGGKSCGGSPENEEGGAKGSAKKENDDDSEKDGMADGVGEESAVLENNEGAGESAGGGGDHGGEEDIATEGIHGLRSFVGAGPWRGGHGGGLK